MAIPLLSSSGERLPTNSTLSQKWLLSGPPSGFFHCSRGGYGDLSNNKRRAYRGLYEPLDPTQIGSVKFPFSILTVKDFARKASSERPCSFRMVLFRIIEGSTPCASLLVRVISRLSCPRRWGLLVRVALAVSTTWSGWGGERLFHLSSKAMNQQKSTQHHNFHIRSQRSAQGHVIVRDLRYIPRQYRPCWIWWTCYLPYESSIYLPHKGSSKALRSYREYLGRYLLADFTTKICKTLFSGRAVEMEGN